MTGEELFRTIFGIFKLSAKTMFVIWCTTFIILYSPFGIDEQLGMVGFAQKYHEYIGLAFIISAVSTSIFVLQWMGESSNKKWIRYKRRNKAIMRLNGLSPDEKDFLLEFLKHGRTACVPIGQTGRVNVFVAEGILARAANIFNMLEGIPYTFTDWAWEYINEHPECISDAFTDSSSGQ